MHDFPESFETTSGILAATQGELLIAAHELQDARAQLETATAELESLRRELELRDAALNAAGSHFMIVDLLKKGRPIVYVNRALASDHGYAPEELIGKSVGALSQETADRQRARQFYAAMAAGRTVQTELLALRRDGTIFQLGVCATPLRNARGVISHYVTVSTCITAHLQESDS